MNSILSKKLHRTNRVVWRIIDGEAIILGTEKQAVYTTNRIGSLIWDNIDGKKTIREIINKIVNEFDVEYRKAKEDTLIFIDELIKHNLVFSK